MVSTALTLAVINFYLFQQLILPVISVKESECIPGVSKGLSNQPACQVPYEDDHPETQQQKLIDTEKQEFEKVCYGDLGCFSSAYPWNAFGRMMCLPAAPEAIKTEFLLCTKKNPKDFVSIKAGDVEALLNSHFDGSKRTIFIVHGFFDWGTHSWLKDMATQFLIQEDVNVFCVDWRDGSHATYCQAAGNTRVVGAEIAKLIKFLSYQTNLKSEDIHVIGHSLGAHIAGYVSASLGSKLGRITGIDPANPFFQNMDPIVRLDENDANFVDVLHTDAGMFGFGTWQPSGHVDVYLNGGIEQPGCFVDDTIRRSFIHDLVETTIADVFAKTVGCSHNRAYDYVIESIGSSCPLRAYRCPSWDQFKTGSCLRCPSDIHGTSCNGIGHRASKPGDGSINGMFWAETNGKPPYCRYHYHIQLVTSEMSNRQQLSKFWFNLFGRKASSGFILASNEKASIKPDWAHDFMVTTAKDLGDSIQSVEVKWEHDAAWYDFRRWQLGFGTRMIYLQKVVVFSGEYQTESTLCAAGDEGGGLSSLSPKAFNVTCPLTETQKRKSCSLLNPVCFLWRLFSYFLYFVEMFI